MSKSELKIITKEEIAMLPLNGYQGEVLLITNKPQAEKAIEEIKKCDIIGMDTEARPAFRRGVIYPVSLLQFATDKKVYLFRLLQTGVLPGILEILEDKNKIKIGIAPGDDMKDLAKSKHFHPQNIIDLNKFAQQNGFESIGAKKLSALVLGIRISKAQQVSNWEAKRLSAAQIKYAATDAWICREIYLKLIKR
jgi:ribonuclease D